MCVMKKRLIGILSFSLIVGGTFYLYMQTLPTSPPQFVQADDLVDEQPIKTFSCTKNDTFDYAYAVNIAVESKVNDKFVYQSKIQLNSQLSQVNGAVITGIASDISIDEGSGVTTMPDMYYLVRAEDTSYALFSAFNDLGLEKQHPLKIMAQFVKAISVGSEKQAYQFAYDSMQRSYRYQYHGSEVVRAGYPTTANIQSITNLFNDFHSNWRAELGPGCVPKLVHSEETQAFTTVDHAGYIKFSIDASLIPLYTNLKNVTLAANANAALQWNIKQINSSDFANPVVSREQMWQTLSDFERIKNTAQLVKVAEYIFANISPTEFAEYLLDADVSEQVKRDLAFALSLTSSDKAEHYIIDAIEALPVAAGESTDLQKVRLIVSLTGNSAITLDAYSALAGLHNNTEESNNVQNNALINMGTIVQQLKQKTPVDEQMSHQLTNTITAQLQTTQSQTSQLSAAILAAGNAQLSSLDLLIVENLTSANNKVRYAAAKVLSRNKEHTDLLINHLSQEPSLLVANAIISNFKPSELAPRQVEQLRDIGNNVPTDLAKLIDDLLI